eukprot:UN27125
MTLLLEGINRYKQVHGELPPDSDSEEEVQNSEHEPRKTIAEPVVYEDIMDRYNSLIPVVQEGIMRAMLRKRRRDETDIENVENPDKVSGGINRFKQRIMKGHTEYIELMDVEITRKAEKQNKKQKLDPKQKQQQNQVIITFYQNNIIK